MPLYDDNGQLVEGALTPEEVAAKLDEVKATATEEAEQAHHEEIDGLQTQLNDKQGALATAQADLEKLKGKSTNFGNQRQIIEQKEKEIEDLKKDLGEFKQSTTATITRLEGDTKNRVLNTMINEITGGRADVNEKVKFYLDAFKPIDETGKTPQQIDEEMNTRIKNAYTLATGGRSAAPISGRMISSAGSGAEINPTGEKLTPELQDMAHKLGVKDEDLKKHKLI